jgi:hypothetical protein
LAAAEQAAATVLLRTEATLYLGNILLLAAEPVRTPQMLITGSTVSSEAAEAAADSPNLDDTLYLMAVTEFLGKDTQAEMEFMITRQIIIAVAAAEQAEQPKAV